ncbi:methionine ABC transporter ATP-binding protein [Alkalihalobacillus pseudalcaliphilus]|uniref:methionine ABC transporter ATP-binding protein n=1 Tax=Alkalihalobacillus pseudalcaliphilus TaxID=79884 RepID=UPI00064D7B9A|nr:methionine ABC transporter ATP-binding protein [Alkalihalobacillus pseudalcaliphilus]KMK77587.1 methionine ABC transporter ATP-binding protein [Alkalihalobacillus pseudalcaliphilus]
MITLSDIQKIFTTKDGPVNAVDGVNLEIKKGQIFGVIGYSGAGKSTLIRMLNMLERPTSGEVKIAGKSLSTLSNAELRKARQEIGMIFQHFNLLWSRTVHENIAFPLEIAGLPKKQRDARVDELIELVGLKGRGSSYPSQLSGGQKQRVGIARALANNPKVLLCDEATSALDPKTTDSILDLLVDINKKLDLTIILITHEMHVIRKICHEVAVMEGGKIVEQGEVLEVFRKPKQEMTKEFVKQITEPEDTIQSLEHFFKQDNGGKVVKLTFVGKDAERPLITELIRHFHIEVNILQGKISKTRDSSYGSLFVHLNGEKEDIEKAIAFIQEEQVEWEVIERV